VFSLPSVRSADAWGSLTFADDAELHQLGCPVVMLCDGLEAGALCIAQYVWDDSGGGKNMND